MNSVRKISAFVAALGLSSICGAVRAEIPAGLVTRLYTEALGRAPDASGWMQQLNAHSGVPCSFAMAQGFARNTYASAEYLSLPYDNTERVITIYRGLLGRDPDAGGLSQYVSYLNGGGTLTALVEAFVTSGEFQENVMNSGGICKTRLTWGAQPAPTGIHIGTGFSGTQSQLQSQLNSLSASGGGTLYLAQRAVILLNSRLDIPSNVTLATTGQPSHTQYAKQARLVRASLFNDVMVSVGGYHSAGNTVNARLQSVWVSGQRSIVGFGSDASATGNIIVPGGTGAVVSQVRTDTPAGWSTLYLHGRGENRVCGSATVQSNLSVGYGSSAFEPGSDGRWADGISNACENALIENNHVVDATDVGIVLMRSSPATQRSIVRNNFIVNGNLPVIAALGVEPLNSTPHFFTGAQITGNTFFAAPDQFVVFGATLGSRQWSGPVRQTSSGFSFVNNTTAGVATRMHASIYVDGAISATVTGNTLTRTPYANPRASGCPQGGLIVNSNSNWAQGTFLPSPVSVTMTPSCLQ